MNKKYFVGLIVALLVIASIIVIVRGLPWEIKQTSTGKIKVTTSFYPLYFFSSEIGGDKAEVTNLTPAGTEPHDYEPTAGDLVQIANSKLLILNGGGLEVWGQSIKRNVDSKTTLIIIAGEGLTNQTMVEAGEKIIDPHVWLSPPLAKEMVAKITKGFIQVDPQNANYYQSNADKLKARLSDLDQTYRLGLKNCKQKSIVTSHTSFGYLAKTYGLDQIPIAGLSPDTEPSPQELAKIVSRVKENNIKYIFFESLVSPRLAQTIATEAGAKTLMLNPIEGLIQPELARGENYLTVMRSNLDNLKIALQCSQ